MQIADPSEHLSWILSGRQGEGEMQGWHGGVVSTGRMLSGHSNLGSEGESPIAPLSMAHRF